MYYLFGFGRAGLPAGVHAADAVDWRACVHTRAQETQLAQQYAARFAPFAPELDSDTVSAQ